MFGGVDKIHYYECFPRLNKIHHLEKINLHNLNILEDQLILEARYHEGIINLVMMHTNMFRMSENALDVVVKIIEYLQSPFTVNMLRRLLII
jgi:hypothetical protein